MNRRISGRINSAYIINFSVGTASPKISDAGDYTFRHNLLPQAEAEFLADFVYNKAGFEEIGIVYVNADAGTAYKEYFVPEFEALGGGIILVEGYESGATDFKTLLGKIKESKAKAVFAISYTQELGFILKQAKELGVEKQWFGLYDAEGPKLLEIAGNAAEGLVYSHYFDPDSGEPLAASYFENYSNRFGKESESYAALCYDSLHVIVNAIEQCGGENPECVKEELYQTKDFPAVTGAITFDEKGDTEKALIAKTVSNCKFVPFD